MMGLSLMSLLASRSSILVISFPLLSSRLPTVDFHSPALFPLLPCISFSCSLLAFASSRFCKLGLPRALGNCCWFASAPRLASTLLISHRSRPVALCHLSLAHLRLILIYFLLPLAIALDFPRILPPRRQLDFLLQQSTLVLRAEFLSDAAASASREQSTLD